ncbi:glycosyl transferase family 1 [Halorhodospira halophila]|nr:glycosyl transferase family 1 [Halorhodospira halophila]
MFRVAAHLPITVVAPVPWFPGQGLIRRWRPGYRPPVPRYEEQAGVAVYHPRFLSFPGMLKGLDGLFLALGALPVLRRLRRAGALDLIDAHFVYPDGVAAWLLGRWFGCPHTITLRGTIQRISRTRLRRWLARRAMLTAARVFSVSRSLRRVALSMGVPPWQVEVVANGVNLSRFRPLDRSECRSALGLPLDARVLITVGTLNERKGFHRVIEQMPTLLGREPRLHYLAVGGGSPDGDDAERLQLLALRQGVADRVHFVGAVAPKDLSTYYSAADVFVLATRFEGWANVLLEAAACGLPVVTTEVGGNAEVIRDPAVGVLVPFGDARALREAILRALREPWDQRAILAHARANAWESRIPALVERLEGLAQRRPRPVAPPVRTL